MLGLHDSQLYGGSPGARDCDDPCNLGEACAYSRPANLITLDVVLNFGDGSLCFYWNEWKIAGFAAGSVTRPVALAVMMYNAGMCAELVPDPEPRGN